MAMNEDSVVSSLNELRRMANDRARRETEARARVEEGSGWDQRGHGRRSDGRIRATEIRGSAAGYQAAAQVAHSPTLVGGHDVAQAPQAGYGYGYGYPAQAALPDIAHEPPRQKSAVGPVLLTILLLGGAAAGGYWKLTQDFQTTLRARDAALLAAEEARNKAVELAARAEALAKVSVTHAEQRAKEAAPPAAPVAAAPPAGAPAADGKTAAPPAPAAKPVVAAKPSKAEKSKRSRRAASTRRVAKAAAVLPPVEEEKKPAALPRLAGKKKYSDDPLAGLKM
jgi:hypothetical protein